MQGLNRRGPVRPQASMQEWQFANCTHLWKYHQ